LLKTFFKQYFDFKELKYFDELFEFDLDAWDLLAEEIILFGVTPGEFNGDILTDNIGLISLPFYAEEILCNLLFSTILLLLILLISILIFLIGEKLFAK
jgi:hypothetical protein